MASQSNRLDIIRRLAGLSLAEIARLRHLFFRLTPDQIPEVFQRAATHRARLIERGRWPSGHDREGEAVCFFMALRAIDKERQGQINRKAGADRKARLDALAKASERQEKQAKKRRPRTDAKRQAVKTRLPFILEKREAGWSWRRIAADLSANTPLKISGDHLRTCVEALTGSEP